MPSVVASRHLYARSTTEFSKFPFLCFLLSYRALTLSVAGSGLPGAVGFVPIPPSMLSLPSGEDMISTTFSLEPVNNLLDEADEILTIAVDGNGTGAEAQHPLQTIILSQLDLPCP